jgi:hypothetical protein
LQKIGKKRDNRKRKIKRTKIKKSERRPRGTEPAQASF